MSAEVWLDVSKYQGDPDWSLVKASKVDGIVFNVDEPNFVQEVQEAVAAGLKVATYHYTATGTGDPRAAAQHHLDAIAPVRGSLGFVAGDHESGSGDLTDWCSSYQDALKAGFGGGDTRFYSGGWWTSAHIRPDAVHLREFPLWDAAYQPSEPATPAPWQSIAMWQHTSSAQCPGIGGNVDENYLYQLTSQGARVSVHLNAPVVAAWPTADGGGYTMACADGGIFTFGNAPGYGSLGGQHLNAPIVGGFPSPSGHGYTLVATDGGIFTFGDAVGHGSAAG